MAQNVTVSPADQDKLKDAVRRLRETAEGDSNDAEIEAGADLADLVEEILL